ncbi:hypothetical protein HNQ91_003649 [Filimonas zeae]|uniref:Uncharacterized protein n=1 Tax=Filimonas zeae TaxID=1737353 RepID=A0A917J084_9BACT|nr:hypothetical protein [Filimonas zeae]MDR6340584.1 hypothetical protein [Filimonas zeae]GGH73412.1 hypothetical protein GCM10011379_34900 [Filimonas zeae]
MSQQIPTFGANAGITGGIICTVATSFNSGDLTKTIILATVGSVVSVIVGLLIKKLLSKWFR